MRTTALVALLAVALLLLGAAPGDAWDRGHVRSGGHVRAHVVIGVGPWWWGPPHAHWPRPYWWYPPPYYVVAPPTVIVQEPPVYVQRPPAPPPPPPRAYWYYCPSARAYYPDVPTCPEPWVKVPPRPE